MGSRAGSPNKNKQALIALLQAKYPDYQPVMEIAAAAFKLTAAAKDAESSEEPEIKRSASGLWEKAGSMHERVAQYVTPKLKAVEVTGAGGGPVAIERVIIDSKDPDAESL